MQRKQRDGKADLRTLPKIEAYLRSIFLGSEPTDIPDLTARLDAVIRLQAHLSHMAINQSPPFDPSTENRRGDLFDWALLFALPLPVVIVTSDEPFINRLRQTKAPSLSKLCRLTSSTIIREKTRLNHCSPIIAHRKHNARSGKRLPTSTGSNVAVQKMTLTDWLRTEPIA